MKFGKLMALLESEQLDEVSNALLARYAKGRSNIIPKLFTPQAKSDPRFDQKVQGLSTALDRISDDSHGVPSDIVSHIHPIISKSIKSNDDSDVIGNALEKATNSVKQKFNLSHDEAQQHVNNYATHLNNQR